MPEILPSYVLITPARNESRFIQHTLRSVVQQTIQPLKWVIVNDGSTDNTSAQIRPYLKENPWIELIELPVRMDRHFAAKVTAFNAGMERIKSLNYSIIGNLDADVTLENDHFEFLLTRFHEDPTLGVAGTVFHEDGYSSDKDSFEGNKHVSGQCQLFRRECYKQIGGYKPNKAGGIDWMAVTTARMLGWKTQSFREKTFFHHRPMGTAERSQCSSSFSYGEKDYYLGGHPLWEIFRVAYRMTKRPYLICGLALGAGYAYAAIRRIPRPVSLELMQFHRKEQMNKLKSIFRTLTHFQNVDSFNVIQEKPQCH